MHVFHNLARVMFSVETVYRQEVGLVQIHKMLNFLQVMFRPIIRTDKTYVGCKYTNFITTSGIFKAFFISDRLYVKCQKTSCFGWSKSSLQPIFSTVKLLFFGKYTNFRTFRKQINEFDHFLRMVVQSLFRIDMLEFVHESTNGLMWHVHQHY